MDKLFELESYQDFEQMLKTILNNITYCSGKKNQATMLKIPEHVLQFTNSDLKAAEEDMRKLILYSNYDMKRVEETIAAKNWDKERKKYFVSLIVQENTNLLYASLIHHISSYGETITQSDWLLKLVLGTSELNTLKYPLLVLILSTVDSNGVQCKKLCEANKDMLMKMIKALELIIEAN